MSYEPTVWVDGDHVTSAKLNKLEQGVNSMSYTPTVWNAGDVVTAEKLNKLEQGVAEGGGGGTTFPTFTNNGSRWSCDMTFTEALAVYNEKVLDDVCPCVKIQRNVSIWDMLFYNADKEAIDRDYDNVPTEVTAGLGFSNGNVLWGNDGNFYELKSA